MAVERVHVLRQEVGSYALMHGTGFELADMLLSNPNPNPNPNPTLTRCATGRLR